MKRLNDSFKLLARVNGRCMATVSNVSNHSTVDVKPVKEMPTEKGSSFLFGISLDARKFPNQCQYQREIAAKHGKLFRVKVFLGYYIVVVANPEDAETVLRNEGKYPSRGNFTSAWSVILESMKDKVSTTNLLSTSEGPEWKALRSELNPVVVPRKLGKHVQRLDAVSETFVEMMQESVQGDGYSTDLTDLLLYWSAEAISRFLYPEAVYFQRNRDQRSKDVLEGMTDFINATEAYLYPKFFLKYFPIQAVKKGKEGFKRYKMAASDILREMEENSGTSTEDPAEGTFMEQWIAQGLSHEAIIANMADFLGAGTDTTTNTAAFTIHQLAKHPHVQEKVHDEVMSVIGREGVITEEALQKLSYVKAIQKETARFAAFTTGIGRVLSENTVVGGYEIPAKTMVVISNTIMSQDPDIFEDPEDFRPERWLRDADKKSRSRQQLATGIFGFGPRMCLGRRVAELELWSLLTKIMQRTRLELHPDSLDLQPTGVTSFRPDRPLRVKLIPH